MAIAAGRPHKKSFCRRFNGTGKAGFKKMAAKTGYSRTWPGKPISVCGSAAGPNKKANVG
ncbi:hypothetical protein F3J20_02820 [Paraburkholderia sp. Cy-641]|uniref:hypothetical protein n=1 Tax=Paraburkholderia sp. Cy-641 TaxID=2608337 RepID=UPI00141E1C46|nr:hypothetical protein [Paraburkholderia sp. Cy-641]NIF76338.1 hypothetical protein [Paraburkholderia sp. Cy-641]